MPSPDRTADPAPLVALIQQQASSEMADLTALTEQRIAKIHHDAEADVQAVQSQAERDGDARGRRRAAALLSTTRATARMQWLKARETLLEDAIAQARAQLEHFATHADAPRVLRALINEAVAALPHQPLYLQVHPTYLPLLEKTRKDLDAADRLTPKPDESVAGGVILESEDGRLRFDNSFDARLHRRKDDVRRLAADVLFTDAGTLT